MLQRISSESLPLSIGLVSQEWTGQPRTASRSNCDHNDAAPPYAARSGLRSSRSVTFRVEKSRSSSEAASLPDRRSHVSLRLTVITSAMRLLNKTATLRRSFVSAVHTHTRCDCRMRASRLMARRRESRSVEIHGIADVNHTTNTYDERDKAGVTMCRSDYDVVVTRAIVSGTVVCMRELTDFVT